MQDKIALLVPDSTYHVYNRANGNERLFRLDENYRFFLEKYNHYISPVADTFCYCLMPSHFHFLIRIKREAVLSNLTGFENRIAVGSNLTGFENLSGLIAKRFSNFFNSYSKAFNKQQDRKGNLFMRPFKRKRITDEKYLKKLVHYIHFNPVEARLAEKPENWKYSSYNTLLSPAPSFLLKQETIEWFGDREKFIYCHQFPAQETELDFFN